MEIEVFFRLAVFGLISWAARGWGGFYKGTPGVVNIFITGPYFEGFL